MGEPAESTQRTATINGKEIIFREKLPAADWWDILPALMAMGQAGADPAAIFQSLKLDTVVAMIQGTIESWELDTDLADADAIRQMDIFTEMTPLLTILATEIGERTSDLGEAASGRT